MTFNRLCSKLILFSSFLLLGACSPKQENSTVRLHFPDWQELRAKDIARQSKLSSLAVTEADLHMLTINVSGPGIANPIYFQWERDSNPIPPRVVTLPFVPRGNDRLVQVLAIYEDGGAMAFYYGDQRINITSDIANAEIEVQNEATVQNLVAGKIVGRFLTGPNTGYTGVINMRFNPPSGAPSMIASKTEFFSGWGELFSLSTSLVSYSLNNGTPIYEGMTNASLALYRPLNMARAARIHIPDGYYDDDHDSSTWYMKPQEAERVIVGYFGHYDHATDSAQRVCVPGSSDNISIDSFYKVANPADPTAAPSDQVEWFGKKTTGLDPNLHAYIEELTVLAVTARGGSEAASCSNDPNLAYTEFLDIRHGKLNHIDEMLGIHGPYRRHPDVEANSSNVVKTTYDAANGKLVLDWKYLPGAAADLAGSSVFYRHKPGANIWDDRELRAGEGFRCNELKSRFGFHEVPVAPGVETAEITGVPTATYSQELQILVCPRSHAGHFFHSAAPVEQHSGGGSGGPVADVIELGTALKNFGTTTMNVNNQVCQPLFVRGTKNGAPAYFPSGTQLTFSDSSSGAFYEDDNCSSSKLVTGPITNLWGQEFVVYYLSTESGALTKTVSVTASGASFTTASDSLTVNAGNQIAEPNKVIVVSASDMFAESCYPAHIVLWDSVNGKVAKDTVSAKGYLNFNGSDPFNHFYDDYNHRCEGSDRSTVSFYGDSGAGTGVQFAMFKYNGSLDGAPSNIAGRFSSSTDLGAPVIEIANVNMTQPGAPAKLQINMPNNFGADTCQPVYVQLTDSNGRPTKNNSATPIQFSLSSSSTGVFKTYSGACGGVDGTPDTNIPVNMSAQATGTGFAYVAGSVGEHEITATVTAGGAIANSIMKVQVGPAIASKVVVGLPGQTWNSGSKQFDGPAPPFPKNVPIKIKLAALTDQSGLLDPLFNLPGLNLQGGGGGSLTVHTSPSWNGDGFGYAYIIMNGSGFPYVSAGGGPTMLSTTFSSNSQLLAPAGYTFKTAYPFSSSHCQPILLSVVNGGNAVPLDVGVGISISGSNIDFYNDQNCSGSVLTVAQYSSAKIVYARASAPSSLTITSDSVSPVQSWGSPVMYFGVADSDSVVSPNHLTVVGHDTFNAGSCQPFAVIMTDPNMNGVPSGSTRAINVTSDVSGMFYTDARCMAGASATGFLSFASTDKAQIIYFRASASGSATLTAVDTSGSPLTSGTLGMTINP